MKKPIILLFRGKPGVGKTTFSNALSLDLQLALIRKDDIYDALSIQLQKHDLKSQLAYAVIKNQILTQLRNGNSAIVDASLHQAEHIQSFLAWSQTHHVPLHTILVMCSNQSLWAQRFNQRHVNPAPNQLITDFTQLKHYYGDLNTPPLKDELVIDSAQPFELNINKIKSWIKNLK